jgi:hypothetical protein
MEKHAKPLQIGRPDFTILCNSYSKLETPNYVMLSVRVSRRGFGGWGGGGKAEVGQEGVLLQGWLTCLPQVPI